MRKDLKDEIYKTGNTVESFANLTGISRWGLMEIYQNKHKAVRGDSIKRIADGLGKPYEYVKELLEC